MDQWIVYILQSAKDERYYIGSTSDLERRLKKHNAGGVDATKYRRPLNMVYAEPCKNKKEAMAREKYLKSLKSHVVIAALIEQSQTAGSTTIPSKTD